MRRKDREMNQDFALNILDRCEWAVLATVGEGGAPYCVPVSIVRAGDFLYFHSALAGEKVACLHRDARVCLTAVGNTRLLTDEFSTEYESAVVQGTAWELTDPDEKVEALRLLCQRLVPSHMDHFDEEISASLKRTGVWKVSLDAVTGKRKKYGKDGKELTFGREET